MAPDIENRQEILRIRRILSIYLAQNISGSIPLSTTTLGVPSEDTRVRRIPPEVSGLRKNYLEALQAHVKAQNEYERVLQGSDEASLGTIRQEQHEIEREASASMTNHLDLLRAQRKYQKLRIIQDYLDLLAQKDAAKPDYLSMTSILKEIPSAPELPLVASGGPSHYGASETQNNTKALTLRLEKAVLRAQNSLENEKQLLAQVKSERQSEASSKISELSTTSAQISALSQTRDELVSWIEQRLAQGNQAEDKPDKLPGPNRDEVPLEINERKKAIETKYGDYLYARKSLLALASARRTPPPQQPNIKQRLPSPDQLTKSQETSPREASVILPYLASYLIPASSAQKGFLQQESYLAKTLADQDRETIKVLEKLADESHLLPTYPLLAAQPRFQHAVAALGSKPRRPAFSDDKNAANGPESQTATQARAWAFAASAARAAKHDEVHERLEHGEKQVDIARSQISELNEILGGDADQGGAESEEDLWAESAGRKPRRKEAKKRGLDGRGDLGIWAGLDGDINIHDDRPENKS